MRRLTRARPELSLVSRPGRGRPTRSAARAPLPTGRAFRPRIRSADRRRRQPRRSASLVRQQRPSIARPAIQPRRARLRRRAAHGSASARGERLCFSDADPISISTSSARCSIRARCRVCGLPRAAARSLAAVACLRALGRAVRVVFAYRARHRLRISSSIGACSIGASSRHSARSSHRAAGAPRSPGLRPPVPVTPIRGVRPPVGRAAARDLLAQSSWLRCSDCVEPIPSLAPLRGSGRSSSRVAAHRSGRRLPTSRCRRARSLHARSGAGVGARGQRSGRCSTGSALCCARGPRVLRSRAASRPLGSRRDAPRSLWPTRRCWAVVAATRRERSLVLAPTRSGGHRARSASRDARAVV